MRVFVLGGYGKVGNAVCRLLAQSDLASEIAVAGRRLPRAKKVAWETGQKAGDLQVDGSDEEMLAVILRSYDLIINAATDDLVLPVLRSAIRARKDYCDANEINERALLLDDQAKSAGIRAIVANGIGPGISSLMGMHVGTQLTEVEQLQMGFSGIFNWETADELSPQLWLQDLGRQIAMLHETRQFIGMIFHIIEDDGLRMVRDFADGRWVDRDPVREGISIPLPRGGRIDAFPYASHEPLWGALPADIGRIPAVENFFSPLPPQLHDLLRTLALRVLAKEADAESATKAFYNALDADPERWLALPSDYEPPPMIWVEAVGEKDGRAVRSSCWFAPGLWQASGYFLTSLALTVAALKILRGEVSAQGIMTAEKTFEPLPFFEEAAMLIPEIVPDGKLIRESINHLPA